MPTKIEKIIILLDLLNKMPNVEFKMIGITKPGTVNISKAKLIDSFGLKTLNSLSSLPPLTEMPLSDHFSMTHYTICDIQIFAIIKRNKA